MTEAKRTTDPPETAGSSMSEDQAREEYRRAEQEAFEAAEREDYKAALRAAEATLRQARVALPKVPSRSKLVAGTDHREHPRDAIRYLIDGFLAPGVVTTGAGYPGSGKTPTILRAAEAVLTGQSDFLGYRIEDVPDDFRVIYLTEESSQLFEVKLDEAPMSDAALGHFDIAYWDQNHDVPWAEMVHEQVVRLDGNGLLVVDTALWWSGILGEGSENDSTRMNELYRPLVRAAAAGLSVVVLTHTTKAVGSLKRDQDFSLVHVRGSGAVVANSGIVFGLKVPADHSRADDQRFFKVLRDKLSGRTDWFYTRKTEDGIKQVSKTFGDLYGALATDGQGSDDVETRVLHWIEANPGNGFNTIQSGAHVRRNDLRPILDSLALYGKVENRPEGRGEAWFVTGTNGTNGTNRYQGLVPTNGSTPPSEGAEPVVPVPVRKAKGEDR